MSHSQLNAAGHKRNMYSQMCWVSCMHGLFRVSNCDTQFATQQRNHTILLQLLLMGAHCCCYHCFYFSLAYLLHSRRARYSYLLHLVGSTDTHMKIIKSGKNDRLTPILYLLQKRGKEGEQWIRVTNLRIRQVSLWLKQSLLKCLSQGLWQAELDVQFSAFK